MSCVGAHRMCLYVQKLHGRQATYISYMVGLQHLSSVWVVNYEELDDRQLLTSIAGSRREALEALYNRYSGPVYSLAMDLLRDPGAAEEVTQDTFFNVWRRGGSYKSDRGSVTAWLFSIAHHRTIDELRKRRRDQGRVQYGVDLTNRPTDLRSRVQVTPRSTRSPSTKENRSGKPSPRSGQNSERLWFWPTSVGSRIPRSRSTSSSPSVP